MNFELLDQSPAKRARRQSLAAVAEDPSHRLRARGSDRAVRRRPARLRRRIEGVRRAATARSPRSASIASSGSRSTARRRWSTSTARRSCSTPTSCCSRWASWAPRRISREALGVERDQRSNYRAEHGKFATSVARRVRRRRLPPRPIARRLGHQRRPRRRARRRRVPHGREPAAGAEADARRRDVLRT